MQPAGHGLSSSARSRSGNCPQQRRLLVEVHEGGRHEEEHGAVVGKGPAGPAAVPARSISDEDGEVHRVADVAVGAADDETVRSEPPGPAYRPPRRRTWRTTAENDCAGEAEQDPSDPEHSPPRSTALDLPDRSAARDQQRGPTGARTRKNTLPMAARKREGRIDGMSTRAGARQPRRR